MMNFQSFPHKNLVFSALVALFILLVGYFYIYKNQEVRKDTPVIAQNVSDAPLPADVDSDNDSLPDWKEKIYGSDMYNPDSDGDKDFDGDEVRVGRDPTKPGPDDAIKYLQDPNFATSTTDVLGLQKEFFANFLKQSAAEIRETTFRDLIKKNVDPKKFQPQHDLLGLVISSDNTHEGIKKYLNAFGDIIYKYKSIQAHRTEEEILDAALKTKNDKDLEELQLVVVTYRNFTSDLKKLEVPSVLAQAHLRIVNGYAGMGEGLLGMLHIFTNPVAGAAGYEAYMKYRLDVTMGYTALITSVIENKLTFLPEEPGYMFYVSIMAKNTAEEKAKK